MSFLTAALYGLGSYGKGKQQHYQNALQQATLDEQRRYDESQSAYQSADLAQRAREFEAKQRAGGVDLAGNPLPLPQQPGLDVPLPVGVRGGPPTDEQMFRYYAGLAAGHANAYRTTGDPRYNELATQYRGLATNYATGTLNLTRGQEITQGKIPLERAQAEYWKQRPGLLRAQLAQQAKIAQSRLGAQYAAIAQRAQSAADSIRARRDIAGNNLNARESIALMTQIGMLNRQDAAQAFAQAMASYNDQQRAVNQNWINQGKAIAAGGAVPAGYDPSGPPQIQFNMPSVPAAQPAIGSMVVVLPNGDKVSLPTVERRPPGPPTNTNPPGAPKDMKPGTVQDFIVWGPAQREAYLNNPRVPQDVRDYLRTRIGVGGTTSTTPPSGSVLQQIIDAVRRRLTPQPAR